METTIKDVYEALCFAFHNTNFEWELDSNCIMGNIDGDPVVVFDNDDYYVFEKHDVSFAFQNTLQLIEHLRFRGQIPQWWSCDPSDKWYREIIYREVLVAHKYGYEIGMFFRNSYSNALIYSGESGGEYIIPTHWRELPTHPREDY